MRITILCDNVVGSPGGIGEHGFAALVEARGTTLLFDTGSGAGILANVATYGKDLRAVRRVVLSHGHYDHAGGLAAVLGRTGPCEVVGHPGIFVPRIGCGSRDGQTVRSFIGIRHRREYLEASGARFVLGDTFREVDEGIWVTGEIPRSVPFETGDPNLFVTAGDQVAPDPVVDDQALICRTDEGLVVLVGCAHAGLLNTLLHARDKTGESRIRAVVGGTHLGFLDAARREETVRELSRWQPGLVAVGHCTGLAVLPRLAAAFGDRLAHACVGRAFEFSSAA